MQYLLLVGIAVGDFLCEFFFVKRKELWIKLTSVALFERHILVCMCR